MKRLLFGILTTLCLGAAVPTPAYTPSSQLPRGYTPPEPTPTKPQQPQVAPPNPTTKPKPQPDPVPEKQMKTPVATAPPKNTTSSTQFPRGQTPPQPQPLEAFLGAAPKPQTQPKTQPTPQNETINSTSTVLTFQFDSFGGMDEGDFILLVSINSGLFVLIIILLCVYRMNYFHKIDDKRIDLEIARLEKKYKKDIIKHRITTKDEIAREEKIELDHKKFVARTTEIGDRLQNEMELAIQELQNRRTTEQLTDRVDTDREMLQAQKMSQQNFKHGNSDYQNPPRQRPSTATHNQQQAYDNPLRQRPATATRNRLPPLSKIRQTQNSTDQPTPEQQLRLKLPRLTPKPYEVKDEWKIVEIQNSEGQNNSIVLSE